MKLEGLGTRLRKLFCRAEPYKSNAQTVLVSSPAITWSIPLILQYPMRTGRMRNMVEASWILLNSQPGARLTIDTPTVFLNPENAVCV